ncbi:hypothetical protein AXF21_02630 [Eubacterium minutum ATCC 700079]|nr:hypothetical protein AXF21_02630 [Eubacterium minutum ATCC 700079]
MCHKSEGGIYKCFIKRKAAVVILIFLTLFSIEECYHETIFKIVFLILFTSIIFFGIHLTLPVHFHNIFMLIVCSTIVALVITFIYALYRKFFTK